MKVKIQGFKCHIDVEFKIKDGQIVLLKGHSGAGKSTLLQAVYWCLYGGLKNVYNNTGSINVCAVTLEVPGMIIYRQKNPELLRVHLSKTVCHEDLVAQKLIDDYFGHKELWLASSYIQQGARCSLLTGSNAERMKLLNGLSFNMDDPETHINRISEELKILNADFTKLQNEFNVECELFAGALAERPVKEGEWLSLEDIASHESKLAALKERLPLLQKRALKANESATIMATLTKSVREVEARLMTLPLYTDSDIERLNASIAELDAELMQARQYAELKRGLDSLIARRNRLLVETGDISAYLDTYFDNTSYGQARDDELRHERGLSTATRLGYQYKADYNVEIEALNGQIASLYEQINGLTELETRVKTRKALADLQTALTSEKARLSTLTEKLQALTIQYNQYQAEKAVSVVPDLEGAERVLREAYNRYEQYVKAADSLSCPHCGGAVKYLASKLYPVDSELITAESLAEAKNRYNEALAEKNRLIAKNNELALLTNKISQTERDYAHTSEAINGVNSNIARLEAQLASFSGIVNVDVDDKMSPVMISEQIAKKKADISRLSALVSALSMIEYKARPNPSSSVIKALIDLRALQAEIDTLTARLGIEGKAITVLEAESVKLRKEFVAMTADYRLRNELKSQLDLYQSKLASLDLDPTAETDYTSSIEESSRLETLIDKAKYANKMLVRQTELESKQAVIYNLYNDITALQKLHATAINVECAQLEETVNNINSMMSEILSYIFDEPITVSLNLTKTLKTSKRVKAEVNLSIQYRGAEYDGISQLSGGEADRVSLALTLALSKVSPSMLLLLDECISSVGGEYREMCNKAIRHSLSGTKTALVICHEEVEGLYDDVINLRK